MATMKHYVCERYPYYQLGEAVQFERGIFATDSPRLQKLIESNDYFGVFITVHGEENLPQLLTRNSPFPTLGMLGTRPVVHQNETAPTPSIPAPIGGNQEEKPIHDHPEDGPEPRPTDWQLKAMKKDELVTVALRYKVALTGEETKAALIAAIKEA